MRATATALATVFLSGLALQVSAQELRGTLRDQATGQPLAQGTVELLSPEGEVISQAVADDAGLFAVSAAEPGTYRVRGWRIGADTVIDGPVDLARGEIRQLDFLLPIDAVELAALAVTVRGTNMLRDVGFYDRQRSSSGTFLDRAEIEKNLRQTTADVLGTVPGVQIDYALNPMTPTVMLRGGAVASSRTAGLSEIPQCYPAVYLDGLRVQEGGAIGNQGVGSASEIMDMTERFDFGTLSPEEIEGVEVFGRPSQVPVQFLGQSAVCGVILIWTRPPGD